jgi:hypothetical protein
VLQAVLQSRPRPPPGFSDPDAAKPLVLQPGSKVLWVGANYFGCVATVLADPSAKITGKAASQGTYYVRVQVGVGDGLLPGLRLGAARPCTVTSCIQ